MTSEDSLKRGTDINTGAKNVTIWPLESIQNEKRQNYIKCQEMAG